MQDDEAATVKTLEPGEDEYPQHFKEVVYGKENICNIRSCMVLKKLGGR